MTAIIPASGSRSPKMVKAQVSPELRANTRPQTEHLSKNDHPENSRPSPQCGQRLRSPRRRTVTIIVESTGIRSVSMDQKETAVRSTSPALQRTPGIGARIPAMSELDRVPTKVQRPLHWVWLIMMILALVVAIGNVFFK